MWFNGSLHIEEYDDNSLKASWLDHGFGAVGGGKGVVIVAHRTLEAFQNLPRFQRYHYILDTSTKLAPSCGEPVDAWRVTQDGIYEDPIVVEQEA